MRAPNLTFQNGQRQKRLHVVPYLAVNPKPGSTCICLSFAFPTKQCKPPNLGSRSRAPLMFSRVYVHRRESCSPLYRSINRFFKPVKYRATFLLRRAYQTSVKCVICKFLSQACMGHVFLSVRPAMKVMIRPESRLFRLLSVLSSRPNPCT